MLFSICLVLVIGIFPGLVYSRESVSPTAPKPDSDPDWFYTTYTYGEDRSSVFWSTCGHASDPGINGCFGSGYLKPFNRVCGMAGNNQDIVVVLDTTKTSHEDNPFDFVNLYVYKQEQSLFANLTLSTVYTVNGVAGDKHAKCQLSLLGDFVYLSTDQNDNYAQVQLSTGRVSTLTTTSTLPVTAITVSNNFVYISQPDAFIGYDIYGYFRTSGSGSGEYFLVNSNSRQP